MKKHIILFLILSCLGLYSQSKTKVISLPNYYDGKGVIFNNDYKSLVEIKDYSKSFTPSLEQIIITEKIFLKQIKNKKKFKRSAKKEFWKYYRQYIGYIKINGEKVIMVNMLNFRKKNKAKKAFENWKEDYIVAFGEFYEENLFSYIVNLSIEKLQLGNW